MEDEYDYLASFGVGGLILLLLIHAIKKRCTPNIFIIFILLLEGHFMWAREQHEVLYTQTWGSFETRKFVCAAIAYTPGVVVIWLIFRAAIGPSAKGEDITKAE